MANEKRLIDANRALEVVREHGHNYPNAYHLTNYATLILREAPTVDAVEVVRCENCQYWNPRYETMGMCMKHNSIVTFTKLDFFCAWGKDKNDGICKKGQKGECPQSPPVLQNENAPKNGV